MRTIDDLKQLQALPLSLKVRMTQERTRQWVNSFGTDGVYIAFSGGKDSTVLLDIVRGLYPDVEAVFVDTGLEFPEVREFVKTFDNVTWLKPKMHFKQVIEQHGYPFISKEISQKVKENRMKPNGYAAKYFIPESEGGKASKFNMTRWKFLLDAPFKISNQCCNVMKKSPSHDYGKKTGKNAITGQTAEESALRQSQWLKVGCNGFDMKTPVSNPMSFWTEQDILQYIKKNSLPICSVYGEIVEDLGTQNINGQMSLYELGINDAVPKLKTSMFDRTGCMFCGYGCHLEKDGEGRFERMKLTHPKQYEWIMKPWEDGGLGYRSVIDWLNENGNLNIKY